MATKATDSPQPNSVPSEPQTSQRASSITEVRAALREQIRKASLTPINDIYYVPPGVEGSWSIPDTKLDKILSLVDEYVESRLTEQRSRHVLAEGMLKQELTEIKNAIRVLGAALKEKQ